MKQLSEQAVLVNLTVKRWTATKKDNKVTRDVEEEHQAHDAGHYSKNLIHKSGLAALKTVEQEARKLVNAETLPWGDNGDRLLPTTNYFEFQKKFGEVKSKYQREVKAFIAMYPNLKEEAKERLNGLFREDDYPAPEEMLPKFAIKIDINPISNLKDFRLNINDSEVNKLRRQIQQDTYEKIADTTRDLYQRIAETVGHMATKLAEQDGIFRNTLVSNISDLVDKLPRLNFTNDSNINDAIEMMKRLIVDPEVLRADNYIRREKAQQAEELLSKLSDFM